MWRLRLSLIIALFTCLLSIPAFATASPQRGKPSARTRAATVRARAAVLRGTVEPDGSVTRYRFEYAMVAGPRRATARRRTSLRPGWRQVQFTLRGLRPGALYRYRLVASNRYGTAYGRLISLRMARNPTVLGSASSTRSMLWGAELGRQFTGAQPPWDMRPVSDFQRLVGKAPGILPFNIPFIDCSGKCTWFWFPTHQMDAIRTYGAIPMVNWSSMSSPLHVDEPGFKLSEVINGSFDKYIRSFAEAAKAWGHPFYLRFNWEMNGNWFPWAQGANGNRPGQSAAAWRHVHNIFRAVGATNVSWVWCPSITTTNATIPLRELYPGNAYVDWTCLDGYNWGAGAGPHGWQSFDQIFSPSYSQLTGSIAPSKPVMIGEVGSSTRGGSKPAWISDMFSRIASGYGNIRALLWFDVRDANMNWPVESSPGSRRAFATGISNRHYLTNGNAALSGPTIGVP